MFSRISHLFLIIALLGATGAHWAALQSVAWAKMLADNSRTASFQEAIEKTFDGKHPCAMCKQIAQGRQCEKKSDIQLDVKKLEFLQDSAVFVISAPVDFTVLLERANLVPLRTQSPPVPPPRFALA